MTFCFPVNLKPAVHLPSICVLRAGSSEIRSKSIHSNLKYSTLLIYIIFETLTALGHKNQLTVRPISFPVTSLFLPCFWQMWEPESDQSHKWSPNSCSFTRMSSLPAVLYTMLEQTSLSGFLWEPRWGQTVFGLPHKLCLHTHAYF